MSARRSSTIKVSNNKKPNGQSKEYADEYKRRYGEDYPEEVKDAPYKVIGRKVKKGAKKIKDKIKKVIGKKGGGTLKAVPADNTGLAKLPTPVRNNMGYMKYGGKVKMQNGGKTSVAMKKKSKKCPINGMAKTGRTRGVTVVA